MDNLEKINQIFNLQNDLNEKTRRDWRNKRDKHYRASWTEAAELVDHFNWEWWKSKDEDIDQAKMELIDILHFTVSNAIQFEYSPNEVLKEWEASLTLVCGGNDSEAIISTTEKYVLSILKANIETSDFKGVFLNFFNLAHILGLGLDDMYRMYVGKHTLNRFRQNNGYKSKDPSIKYIKTWGGKEDNEYLTSFLRMIAKAEFESVIDMSEAIYSALEERYQRVLEEHSGEILRDYAPDKEMLNFTVLGDK